jgi:hypothetical protein
VPAVKSGFEFTIASDVLGMGKRAKAVLSALVWPATTVVRNAFAFDCVHFACLVGSGFVS